MKIVENPPNPFQDYACEYFEGIAPPAKLEIYEDHTKNILSKNDSPDLGFTWSINPYRGCQHACAYCFARPTHEYLGWGAGSDFDTKILVKKQAPELLRAVFMKKSWKGDLVVMSGDTDCYQPLEASYQITRKLLKVFLEFGNPLSIITKSFLITRDIDLLTEIHERTHLSVNLSIPFADDAAGRVVEPGAAAVSKRFEAVALLSARGISVNIMVAPIIPGLSDCDVPRILKRAAECGARSASPVLLRLPGPVKEIFLGRMKRAFPDRYQKIENSIRRSRGGELYRSAFGKRFEGQGEEWESVMQAFEIYSRKYKLNSREEKIIRAPFARPGGPQKEFLFAGL